MNQPVYLEHDWFPAALPSNVVIGERSWLYSTFAFRHYHSRRVCGVRVGRDCGLYNGTFFDLGPDGEVEIGNWSTLVGAIVASNSRISIGDYVFIAHEVVVADSFVTVPSAQDPARIRHHVVRDNVVTDDAASDDGAGDSRQPVISIGENCWIGARAILLAGAQLGPGAIIGAGAVVDFEVPSYAIVAGNPARVVGWSKPASDDLDVQL